LNRVVVFVAISLLAIFAVRPFAAPTSQRTIEAAPAFSFPFIFAETASCSLDTGVCATTIVNTGAEFPYLTNSSYDLLVDSCHLDIITYSEGNYITINKSLPGTVGGFYANRFPGGTVATSTCSLPTSMLTYEPSGHQATGYFTMELANNLGPLPAGKNATVIFEGNWTGSTKPVTTTSTMISASTLTTTTTSTVDLTTTTTATAFVTMQNGDIVGSPYELLVAAATVVLLVATFLVVWRRPVKT